MASEHEIYYREVACGSAWCDEDADRCGCKGSGWWLSELDTWHKCPLHAPNAEHPEYMQYDQMLIDAQYEADCFDPRVPSVPEVIDENDIPF